MVNDNRALVRFDPQVPAELPPVEQYLARIRPQWQATPLVRRVRVLLPIDPSSACQRLLNAAGHDLRAKISTLGLDLAQEVARQFKLPHVDTEEDLEDYSTSRLYDLAFRLGLLTRPEWRRLHRAYEIRRDLEHEDDEYEASPADVIYILETAIEVVLAKEPVQVIRLDEIAEVVESDGPVVTSPELIEDFQEAPPQRQTEIFKALANWAKDDGRPEIVRSNCFRLLRQFAPMVPVATKIELAEELQLAVGRRTPSLSLAQVSVASGAFPFIQRRYQRPLVQVFLSRFSSINPDWRMHAEHGELLDDFEAAGAFSACPAGAERRVLRWMIEAYLGEPGRRGMLGRNRAVFFSDTAAPRIEAAIGGAPPQVRAVLVLIVEEAAIRNLLTIPEQGERLQRLCAIAAGENQNR